MSEADRQTERVEQLLAALRDDNEALRDHAVASLGQMGLEALPRLIGLLADEDIVIREAATSAIIRIGRNRVKAPSMIASSSPTPLCRRSRM